MRQDLRGRIVALALAVLIIFAFLYWFEGSSVTRVSGVVTVGVGVYWGMNCSQPVASINWGSSVQARRRIRLFMFATKLNS